MNHQIIIDDVLDDIDRIMFDHDKDAYADARFRLLRLRRFLAVEEALREQPEPEAEPLPEVVPITTRKKGPQRKKQRPARDMKTVRAKGWAMVCPQCGVDPYRQCKGRDGKLNLAYAHGKRMDGNRATKNNPPHPGQVLLSPPSDTDVTR